MGLRLSMLPDDVNDWPEWLESEIVGPRLNDLVCELEVLFSGRGDESPSSAEATLEQVLGDVLDSVIDAGLSKAPPETLRTLLERPQLLFDLQDRVFEAESAYWMNRCQAAYSQTQADPAVISAPPEDGNADGPKPAGETDVPNVDRRSRVPMIAALLLATAAVLLLMFGLMRGVDDPRVATAWGFNQDELYESDESPSAYFESLADAAGEWFDERPETADALAGRLAEFSQGCQRVIDSEHSQLADLDWQWLTNQCSTWKQQIDQLATQLDADTTQVIDVRERADDLINDMIKTLKDRSAELVSSRSGEPPFRSMACGFGTDLGPLPSISERSTKVAIG